MKKSQREKIIKKIAAMSETLDFIRDEIREMMQEQLQEKIVQDENLKSYRRLKRIDKTIKEIM